MLAADSRRFRSGGLRPDAGRPRAWLQDTEAMQVNLGSGVLVFQLQVTDLGAVGIPEQGQVSLAAVDERQLGFEHLDGCLRIALEQQGPGPLHGGLDTQGSADIRCPRVVGRRTICEGKHRDQRGAYACEKAFPGHKSILA